MNTYRDYFPTKAYKIAEKRLGSLLGAERNRLDCLAEGLGRKSAIGPDNLLQQLPCIIQFTQDYHKAFDIYLKAVIPQQPRPIQCRPACGNCCHHYPMSVEPFELIYVYQQLRSRPDLISVMEACQMRSGLFERFYEERLKAGASEDDAEDEALHDFFSAWHSCPFSNKVGDCTIYPIRSVSCRMYFSETEPKYCTPEFLQTDKNDSYIVYLPDNVEEAVFGISEHYEALQLPESFFGGLLALNGYEGMLDS
ncbi:MAG: YkgJ family cysteine cluster protein [Fibrobacteraceae bacterium]|nr:YkgJ family cysteine cluster protein [Fibrobacteraceae bacterium]